MKRLTEKELSVLILLVAMIFGIWLRLAPAFQAGFPMNDGGMFLVMIQDLRQNSYALPAFTSYNNLDIPFTYPPLPFYLAGLVADIFHFSDLNVLLWLPALINILTLPAFALLAKSFLRSNIKSALATLLYTLTPLSMDWFLMGGGLTRGMGQLFLILTCWCANQLFTNHARKYVFGTIIFGWLVVLTHPESALLTITSAVIIWLFSDRTTKTIINAVQVAVGIALLSAPWLVYVLHAHGIAPFLNAMQTGGNSLFLWKSIFSFDFSQETGLAILSVLGLVGLFIKIGKKDYLLPTWLVIPFFINPRSSSRAAIIPLVLLAAISLKDVILPAIQGDPAQKSNAGRISRYLFLAYIFTYMLINAYTLDAKMAANRLSSEDLLAMEWVKHNTPPESRFIILTGETQTMRDPVQEWFPALTRRRSQTTLQGLEWIWGQRFIESIVTFQDLQNCIHKNAACLAEQSNRLGISFTHIYLKKQGTGTCGLTQTCQFSQNLLDELKTTTGYRLAFEDPMTAIFSK